MTDDATEDKTVSETLLIDLSSPGDTLQDKSFPPPSSSTLLIKIDSRDKTDIDEEMDRSFAA